MARRRTLLLSTAAAVAALGAAGAVLAPTWQRPRFTADFAGLPSLPSAPAAPAAPPVTTDLSVGVAGTTLRATVHSPTTPGRHPAVVLVPGGGPATRAGLTDQADRLARAGVVALVFDKRTAGYSFVRRDYGQLAEDALALLRVLRARPDVDPQRAGLWGVSEGGWVVPLAAAREPSVAFAILVNAPTTSPGAQLSWAVDDRLRRQHAPAGARRLAARATAMGGTGYTDHDPLPALRGLTQPVLALYGSADRAVPPAQSARVLVDTVTAPCTVRFFPGADHGMKIGGRYADGYFDTMVSWIAGLPGSATAGPTVAGAAPEQAEVATEPPVPAYGSAPVVLGAHLALLAGASTALVAVRRSSASAGPAGSRAGRAVRRAAWAGVGTAVGINAGVGTFVGLGFVDAPPAVSHGMWLLVRGSAVGAVLAAVAAADAVVGARRSGWRPGPSGVVALAGGGVAATAALGLAAYWELFAPRW
ncbi:alpha/beta hydrolase family protein [Micromonospora sp. DT31]|uniref:alpha/beta hydrolase family protein n=1 Tax=Micromonospora sp. DT31 TaxID=3393434 RepID=UPI003CF315BA